MLTPPIEPMEARTATALPEGPEWQYEPKWDGFRCLLFRRNDGVFLQSKSKPLARYFPEIVAVAESLPQGVVLDGELLIEEEGVLSFDALLLRLHPAERRVRELSARTPAHYVVFDCLEADGEVLIDEPLLVRRERLESLAVHFPPRLHLSPTTFDPALATAWLDEQGLGLDGLVAKLVDAPYTAGERIAMVKVKHIRTADCVVGGFRYASKGHVVGSLLLGLYDDAGLLHHVGFTSAFAGLDVRALTHELEALRGPSSFTGRSPGGPSRWNRGKESAWEPVRPERVVEVSYDHVSNGRFRHGTGFVRWRPDKAPARCRLAQIERTGGSARALHEPESR